ncbi:MAG: YceI family protein [Isosphaeraceae bacterium]
MNLPTILGAALFTATLATTPASAAETFTVDPVHSTVVFRIKHLDVSYAYGRFNDVAGTFTLDRADPAKARFDFTVKTDSLDTGNAKRDQHVKGPDLFNAQQFPTITFQSTKVAAAREGAYQVTGNLTMHGVTKPLTVQIEPTGTGKGMQGVSLAGIETTFTIRRADFQMTGLSPLLGDEVRLTVSVEGNYK